MLHTIHSLFYSQLNSLITSLGSRKICMIDVSRRRYKERVHLKNIKTFGAYNILLLGWQSISRSTNLALNVAVQICTRLKFIGTSRVFVNLCWSRNNDIGRRTEAAARSLTTVVMYCPPQIYWHLCLVAFAEPHGARRPLQMRVIRAEITRQSFSRTDISQFGIISDHGRSIADIRFLASRCSNFFINSDRIFARLRIEWLHLL